MKKISKPFVYLVIIGLSVLLTFSGKLNALYLFFILVSGIIIYIAKNRDERNRRFLLAMLVFIVITRLILSLAVSQAKNGELSQDEGLYSRKAFLKAVSYRCGENCGPYFKDFYEDWDMMDELYGYNLFTKLLSFYYYIFGYQVQGARLINIFLFIISFLALFHLTKELFNEKAAKISSFVYIIFPSLALWSVSIGTDTIVITAVVTFLYSLVRFFKKISMTWISLMIISLYAISSIKKPIMGVLLITFCVSFIFKLLQMFTAKGRKTLILISVLLSLVLFLPFSGKASLLISGKMKAVIDQQRSYSIIDDAGYFTYPEYCYVHLKCGFKDFLKGYSKGMMYVMFSPFPWDINSRSQLLAYPQMVLWYTMLPFIFIGMFIGFKKHSIAGFILFFYTFAVLSVLAVIEGNIGAVFRHRDLITPCMIIFFGGGAIWVYGYIKGLNKGVRLNA